MQSETWTVDQYQADLTAMHTEMAYVAQCGFWAVTAGELRGLFCCCIMYIQVLSHTLFYICLGLQYSQRAHDEAIELVVIKGKWQKYSDHLLKVKKHKKFRKESFIHFGHSGIAYFTSFTHTALL